MNDLEQLDELMFGGIEFESTYDGWRAYIDGDYDNCIWASSLSELLDKLLDKKNK